MNELFEILKEANPEDDCSTEKALIDNAVFDSFDVVQKISIPRKQSGQ